MSNLRRAWKLWAAHLGQKIGEDHEADGIAVIRTFWWIIHIITCNYIQFMICIPLTNKMHSHFFPRSIRVKPKRASIQ